MARFASPITDMKPLGYLLFYKSKTNTELITYKDELETIENTTQVAVNADGNVANVFFSGSAKVKYFDQFGVQYAERDPVGGSKELGNFSLWSADVIFDENDLVTGSNGSYYKSLVGGNQDNDPVLDAGSNASWEEVTFTGVWNSSVTYDVGDISKTTTGNLWKAVTATAGNDPETDDGTNWLPSIDGSKIAEVATNTANIATNTSDITTNTGSIDKLKLRTPVAGASSVPVGFSYFATANATITMDDVTDFTGGEKFSIVASLAATLSVLTVDGTQGEEISPRNSDDTDTAFNLKTAGTSFEFIFNAVTGNWEV